MAKTVWIMNHYASHMLFDKGGRHYWFAKYLDRAGYYRYQEGLSHFPQKPAF